MPRYKIDITIADKTSQFATRADTAYDALRIARAIYHGLGAVIGTPVPVCTHSLESLRRVTAYTASPRRAQRVYQCALCGEYITVVGTVS